VFLERLLHRLRGALVSRKLTQLLLEEGPTLGRHFAAVRQKRERRREVSQQHQHEAQGNEEEARWAGVDPERAGYLLEFPAPDVKARMTTALKSYGSA
jgi:hypothetical protein